MSLEFVSSSESEEFLALCANPVVIEDRLDRLRRPIVDTVAEIQAINRNRNCKHLVHASFEILLQQNPTVNNENYQNRDDAILIVARHFTPDDLLQLLRLFVQLGIDIHRTTTASKSVSFFCKYQQFDLMDLINTIIDHGVLSLGVCNTLVHMCQHNSTNNLIDRVRTLIDHGIENVRLDCDSANPRRIVKDVENIFSHLSGVVGESLNGCNDSWDNFPLFNTLKSCRTTVHLNIHSPLYQRMIFNHQIDHVDESGLFSFNTRENSVRLPAFSEWQSLHSAWHQPEENADNRKLGQRIIRYLDEYSHRRERCDNKSPNDCQWCRVGDDVDDYLNRLIDKVGEMCSLFSVERIIRYGSSAEKTNIFQASEFDRGVVLENFHQSTSDANQIVYTGNDPAYAKLLTDGEHQPINSSGLLHHFLKSITEALERVYCVHIFAPTVAFGETCVTVYFLYRGRHPCKAIKVSVDITIAVKSAQKPTFFSNGWFMCDRGEGQVILLVPHRRGVGSQWRLSYPTLERDMLLEAGDAVTRVYQLLKFLTALHHSKENLKREIPRKSSLSSYALKTCLFRYMRHHYRPPPWQPEDILRHAVGILRQFPLYSCEMTSYFNKEIVVFNVTQKSKEAVREILSMLNKMI